jgi:hypothetical protein
MLSTPFLPASRIRSTDTSTVAGEVGEYCIYGPTNGHAQMWPSYRHYCSPWLAQAHVFALESLDCVVAPLLCLAYSKRLNKSISRSWCWQCVPMGFHDLSRPRPQTRDTWNGLYLHSEYRPATHAFQVVAASREHLRGRFRFDAKRSATMHPALRCGP